MSDITVVPAQAGYFVVHGDKEGLSLGDPVIAWAVEAGFAPADNFIATSHPVTPNGDPGDYAGFQYPDGKVSILQQPAESLEDAQRRWAEAVERGVR